MTQKYRKNSTARTNTYDITGTSRTCASLSRRNANYLKCVIMSVERVHQNKWHIWAISVIQILPGKEYNKLWVSGLDIDLNDDAKWWRQRQSGEQLLDLNWDPISHCILCPTMWRKSNTPQSAWQSDPGMSIHFEPQWLTCMQNWLSWKAKWSQ
jgi:hypothetical protein